MRDLFGPAQIAEDVLEIENQISEHIKIQLITIEQIQQKKIIVKKKKKIKKKKVIEID